VLGKNLRLVSEIISDEKIKAIFGHLKLEEIKKDSKKDSKKEFKKELKSYILKRNIKLSKQNWKKNNKNIVSQQKKRAYKRKVELQAFMNILLN
jgi:hypothetical protein